MAAGIIWIGSDNQFRRDLRDLRARDASSSWRGNGFAGCAVQNVSGTFFVMRMNVEAPSHLIPLFQRSGFVCCGSLQEREGRSWASMERIMPPGGRRAFSEEDEQRNHWCDHRNMRGGIDPLVIIVFF